MPSVILDRINSFNAAHPWSHNDFYQRWILRQLPPQLARSIDVGCGTGNLVRALAGRVDLATGIDVDPGVIALAREISGRSTATEFEVLGLLDAPATGQYGAVTAVAVVHHLPLLAALTHLRALLAPSGTIVIVGCYRSATRGDRAVEAVAVVANLIMGFLLSARATTPATDTARARDARVAMSAPTAEPELTLAEIRAVAGRVLPGARLRRRLFWRYSLVYTEPAR